MCLRLERVLILQSSVISTIIKYHDIYNVFLYTFRPFAWFLGASKNTTSNVFPPPGRYSFLLLGTNSDAWMSSSPPTSTLTTLSCSPFLSTAFSLPCQRTSRKPSKKFAWMSNRLLWLENCLGICTTCTMQCMWECVCSLSARCCQPAGNLVC